MLVEKSISIVIPAYNESERIGKTLLDIMSNVTNLYEIIVVFDGNDSTPEIVKSVCPNAKVLHFTEKLGKGKAIVKGIHEARGDMVAYLDADGAIPPIEVERLKKLQKKGNFIVSSRWSSDAVIQMKQPFHRILLGRFFHYFVYVAFRIPLKDTQCGMKIFNTEDAKNIIRKVRVFDWAFDISMIYHGMELGLDPKEVGITWSDESDSKLKVFRTVPRMFFSVVLMWIINRHDRSFRVRNLVDMVHAKIRGQQD